MSVLSWRRRQTRLGGSPGHARRPALPKKTFEAAADAKLDLIVHIKDNQPTLHHQAKALCAIAVPLSHVSSRDQRRNRQEERCVSVFDAAPAAIGTEWSTLVGAVIRVERDVLTRCASTGLWRRSTETAFYLAAPLSQPPVPPPSAITGTSRTPRTIAATSPWPRTAPASASIPAFSPASAARLQHPQSQPPKLTRSGPLSRRYQRARSPPQPPLHSRALNGPVSKHIPKTDRT